MVGGGGGGWFALLPAVLMLAVESVSSSDDAFVRRESMAWMAAFSLEAKISFFFGAVVLTGAGVCFVGRPDIIDTEFMLGTGRGPEEGIIIIGCGGCGG